MVSGDRSSCVRHAAKGLFFVLYEDYLKITGYHYAQASALRVLETKTDDRLTYLREAKQEVSEEGLWITLDRDDFAQRSLGLYDGRSYHDAVPQLEKMRFVETRYIKLDENGNPLKDEHGRLLVYCTIQEARRDRSHTGLIVKQYRFDYRRVNAAIDRLDGGEDLPPPQAPVPPPPPSDGPGDGLDEAREGNLKARSRSSDPLSIVAEPTEIFPEEGTNGSGSFSADHRQNFPDPLAILPIESGKSSTYKNLLRESDSSRISEESAAHAANRAPGGADTSHNGFEMEDDEEVWSQEAILNLAAIYLEVLPTTISRVQMRQNDFDWNQAAKHIQESSVFRGMDGAERINHLVRTLRYVTTLSSPCSLRRFMFRKRPDKPMRLWHIANNLVSITCEMEKFNWWPMDTGQEEQGMLSADGGDRVTEDLVPVAIEELAGMDEEEADGLVATIAAQCPGWGVRKRRAGLGGYLVEFSADYCKAVRLYAPDEWGRTWSKLPEARWAWFRTTHLDADGRHQQAS